MDNNKLGYAEFNENLIYMSGFDDTFKNENDALLKDLSYSLWEDYNSNELFIKNYVDILGITLDKIYAYGVKW